MISQEQILFLSRLGMRGTFGQIMMEVAKNNRDIMVLTADLGITAGLQRYMENFSEQFLNVGIAEQNLINVSAGLQLEGYHVFAISFAPFITARCCEQIKVNLGEMKLPIKLVGIASGFEMEYFGNSHYGFDDIGVLRSISGLTIVCPSDTTQLVKIISESLSYPGAIYIRLTKMDRKGLIYKEDINNFKIGKSIWLKKPGQITIIATGSIVSSALKISQKIERDGISCGVLDMHTLKPADEATIKEACKKSKLIVTLEEHSIIGGLGSVVAEIKTEMLQTPPQLTIGISDIHKYVGDYDYLLKSYQLDIDSVYEKVITKYKEIKP